MDIIENLRLSDELLKFESDYGPVFIHKDHRWLLCLIHHAQEKKLLPRPCKIVYFDKHHDSICPHNIEAIKHLRSKGVNSKGIFQLCKEGLCVADNDWLIAGMELGLISDAVAFGVQDRGGFNRHRVYPDHLKNHHSIWLLGQLLSELESQGCLTDSIRRDEFEDLWNILNWKDDENGQFSFKQPDEKILLDFDLDCFAINWDGLTFPWPDEVFAKEFMTSSTYDSTKDWNGSEFIKSLFRNSGIMTISTEPSHCGGRLNVRRIVAKFNNYIFNNKLLIPTLPH